MHTSQYQMAEPTDKSLQWLEQMQLIRTYELHLAAMQSKGVPGTCTSVGQEACAVGVMAALDKRDRILTNHRSAAHLLARGASPGRLLAEVLGRIDGYCGGFSGSLHISAKELGVILTSTIVGGELSMAPGVALAQKMGQGEAGGIVTVFFGDGAACEGIFHEALNLAVQWQLPLLFVCENNQWQAFVHRLETMPDNAIINWARGHGLMVDTVDGNDVHAVFESATQAVSAIRSDSMPRFLELCTYRQRGHFEPDDQAYVDRQELAHWLERDPIKRLCQRLLQQGMLTQQSLNNMQQAIDEQIQAAQAFADASPWPDAAMLTRHVYA
ncbi:thiamine pyrophosphate-dependent dehydrogenase E1 component subunit alpha [Bowmanella dokdonensis]|uniref:Thiamine pyrophosphate-dependent dehydrogenase E1 component subunit alpha n=1 Tax=Bowmanella dokdonensis TaxID=751969 RepID=A0A939DNQ5_9ALTE|nr:thiamine pyrophosphate-dependent dehydrogenase E1 component subunit alpha [Bowmanella dokdonensis]MBN7825490.1 thiamine pyrophosphate-dependent dehydrogenase E1 component subunit alpha [Bowmanella dokdonensis]